MTRTERFKFVRWWLLIGAIAAGVCALRWPSAHLGDEYLPFTNDSFYHARRILDTVADPSAFYEVDMKIHAPEGSLLPWPWGYDYAMAWLVKAGTAIGLADSPLAILIWLPVAAVFVSIGLMMLVARRLGLTDGLVVVAGLAAAVSPLTQYLHGVGQIDHHFAEYIFVLATIACGLKWLSRPVDQRAAIVLGIVLGMAPVIHNALFILQLPVLASLLVLWSQDVRTPLRAALAFAAALLLTTLAILLPSLPFRLGMFEFYTLSWFHLYVAAGSAATVLAFSVLARSRRNVALLAGMALLLVLPLVRQIALAGAFLGGTVTRLETIVEMHSIPPMALTDQGRMTLSQVYSLLLWLTPAAAVYCCMARLAGTRHGARAVLDLLPVRPRADAHATSDALLRLVRHVPAVAATCPSVHRALARTAQAGHAVGVTAVPARVLASRPVPAGAADAARRGREFPRASADPRRPAQSVRAGSRHRARR